ncbi:MAG: hypothetical protein WD425_16505 [Nitrospirales bacterium]
MEYVKKLFSGCCVMLAVLSGPLAGKNALGQDGSVELDQAEVSRIVGEVAIPYVTALQTGDVQNLERLIDGQLAVTLGTLLRDNREYPNFLREKFGKNRVLDTTTILERKVSEGFVKTANAQGAGSLILDMSRSDGSLMSLQLSFDKDTSGNWKVVDQKIMR